MGRKKCSACWQVTAWHGWGRHSVQTWESRRRVRMEAATWAAQLGGSEVLRLPASPPFQEASQSGACNSPPSRGGSGMWKLAQTARLPTLLQSRTPGTGVHHVEKRGSTPRPSRRGSSGCRVAVVPRAPRRAHSQPCSHPALPWVTASGPGLTVSSAWLSRPQGQMGTEASFLPTLCL